MDTQPELSNPIRLFLVDDHAVMLKGLHDLFETSSSISVVGVASTGQEAVEQSRRCKPTVVMTDLRLPDMTGIDVCLKVRADEPTTSVIILTAFLDDAAVLAAAAAGAAGFILKSCEADVLMQSVEQAAVGDAWLDPPAARSLLGFVRRAASSAVADRPMDLLLREKAALAVLSGMAPERSMSDVLQFNEYLGRSAHH